MSRKSYQHVGAVLHLSKQSPGVTVSGAPADDRVDILADGNESLESILQACIAELNKLIDSGIDVKFSTLSIGFLMGEGYISHCVVVPISFIRFLSDKDIEFELCVYKSNCAEA